VVVVVFDDRDPPGALQGKKGQPSGGL
jgi:hypothetical protein